MKSSPNREMLFGLKGPSRKVSTEYVRSTHQLTSKTLTSGRLRTLFHLLFAWSVDPDLGVEGGWGWHLVYKAFGVVLIGAFQNLGSSIIEAHAEVLLIRAKLANDLLEFTSLEVSER